MSRCARVCLGLCQNKEKGVHEHESRTIDVFRNVLHNAVQMLYDRRYVLKYELYVSEEIAGPELVSRMGIEVHECIYRFE